MVVASLIKFPQLLQRNDTAAAHIPAVRSARLMRGRMHPVTGSFIAFIEAIVQVDLRASPISSPTAFALRLSIQLSQP
jgi:hypothetical protein